ncbi:hypothetical protein BS78_10G005700 [Paspalum vaginatum]|nr:hypothetical protein BS78_10G005700 [Paspalum vaginatum]
MKKVDKIRRSFLWKGSESAGAGHCLISWPKAARPKVLGGLGILDFEKFSRALCLRWLWLQWTDEGRPWVGTNPPCNEIDDALFRASTVVTVGNGRKASFWSDPWINGTSARLIAPTLFAKSSRKNISVLKAMRNNSWISHISPVSGASEIIEFVALWEALSEAHMNPEVEDEISWHWTDDGVYSTKSAYLAQFIGGHAKIKLLPIWKAKVEPKCRFFAWTLLRKKILTAENLQKRGWSNDPICKLCNQEPETIAHMFKNCVFARVVWAQLTFWLNLASLPGIVQFSSVYIW